jgi:hypothetical protein
VRQVFCRFIEEEVQLQRDYRKQGPQPRKRKKGKGQQLKPWQLMTQVVNG